MFDLSALQSAVEAHGKVARIVIAGFQGSSPREVGAAMLVWAEGASGTIGGGALEWQAMARARALLATGGLRVDHEALGPNLGQCCGGRLTLVTEVFGPQELAAITGSHFARPLKPVPQPLAVTRLLAEARAQGQSAPCQILHDWLIEPLERPRQPLWIWGAGHVGRAVVEVLRPLPDLQITWIDTDRARFPENLPKDVTPIWTPEPALLVRHAPQGAQHLIFTFSHALDLELCHHLLREDRFGFAGLIGSATKWARFQTKLQHLGHSAALIRKIRCPIGETTLGKHPQAIAIGVAQQLLSQNTTNKMERPDDRRHDGPAFAFGGADEGLSRRSRQ